MAIATITQVHKASGNVRRVECAIVFDSTTGAFNPASALLAFPFEGRLLWLETNPGAVAPTDNYDISLVDTDGADRLLGVGQNRDTATTELVPIVSATSLVHAVVDSDEYTSLTWTITGNSVNSATVRIVLYYTPNL